jgi:hypothetical protein
MLNVSRNPEGESHLEDLGEDGSIILKLILEEQDVSMWIRTSGSGQCPGGSSCGSSSKLRFHEGLGGSVNFSTS